MQCSSWIVGLGAAATLGAGFASAQQAEIKYLPAETIQWEMRPGSDLAQAVVVGSPQRQGLYAVQVKFPKGGKALPHTHPDERILNVIAGTLYFAHGTSFEEAALKPYGAGSVINIPPNVPHYVMAKDGEAIVQEAGFGPTATVPWKN